MEIGKAESTGFISMSKQGVVASETSRPEKDSLVEATRESARKEKKVQAEELLDKISALTEGGLYSVRFERDKQVNDIVVKVIEQETGELIRQIPAEELLGVRKALEDFRGNIVDELVK